MTLSTLTVCLKYPSVGNKIVSLITVMRGDDALVQIAEVHKQFVIEYIN